MGEPGSTSPKVPVLLLKTKSSPHDGYEEYFLNPANGDFLPYFVPVLEHNFRQDALSEIRTLLVNESFYSSRKEPNHKYGGIIFTSQRAVEAFSTVVHDLRGSQDKSALDSLEEVPLYVVGPATARGLRALELPCPVLGEETGNGEALASFILDHYNDGRAGRQHAASEKLPLLFLVGEQRRDVIPVTLQSTSLRDELRIGVDEMVVYETGEMPSFRSHFESLLKSALVQSAATTWVVVFSPTGCQAMLETLARVKSESESTRDDLQSQSETYIGTIGPTTRDYLVKNLNRAPDICATKPSPEGIGDAIKRHLDGHQT